MQSHHGGVPAAHETSSVKHSIVELMSRQQELERAGAALRLAKQNFAAIESGLRARWSCLDQRKADLNDRREEIRVLQEADNDSKSTEHRELMDELENLREVEREQQHLLDEKTEQLRCVRSQRDALSQFRTCLIHAGEEEVTVLDRLGKIQSELESLSIRHVKAVEDKNRAVAQLQGLRERCDTDLAASRGKLFGLQQFNSVKAEALQEQRQLADVDSKQYARLKCAVTEICMKVEGMYRKSVAERPKICHYLDIGIHSILAEGQQAKGQQGKEGEGCDLLRELRVASARVEVLRRLAADWASVLRDVVDLDGVPLSVINGSENRKSVSGRAGDTEGSLESSESVKAPDFIRVLDSASEKAGASTGVSRKLSVSGVTGSRLLNSRKSTRNL